MQEITGSGQALEIQKELQDAWRDPNLPLEQRKLVENELSQFSKGELKSPHPYLAMTALLNKIPYLGERSVLEVGCASGYYTPVLSRCGMDRARYVGCDYSAPLIKLAKEKHPEFTFEAQDARYLEYPDRFASVVIEGCVIIHVAEWDFVLKEVVRVAKDYVLLHRTPFSRDGEPHLYLKESYGVKMFERHYPEQFLKAWMEKKGLTLIAEEGLQQSDTYHYKSTLWRRS